MISKPDHPAPTLSLRPRAFAAVRWTALRQALDEGARLLVFLALARLLAPSVYGQMAIIGMLLALGNLLAEGGFGRALVQRERLQPAHLDTAFWTQCAIAVAIAAAIALAAPAACAAAGYPQLTRHVQVAALVLPLTAANAVQLALLEREFRSRAIAAARLSGVAVSSAVALMLAATGFGLWSLIAQPLLYALCGVVVCWAASPWRPGRALSRAAWRDLAGFSAAVTAGATVNVARKQADKLIVGAAFGAAALGLYSVAQRLVELLTQVTSKTVSQVALPVFSRLQSEHERLRRAYAQAVRVTSAAAFGLFAWLALTAPDLIATVLGAGWREMAPVLQILALHGIFSALLSVDTAAIHAGGRSARRLLLNLLRLALTLAAYAALIDYGLLVVCAAGVAATLAVMPLELHEVNRTLGIGYRDHLRHLAPAACAAVVMVLAILGLRATVDLAWPAPWWRWTAESLLAAATYAAVLLAFDRSLLAAVRELVGMRRAGADVAT